MVHPHILLSLLNPENTSCHKSHHGEAETEKGDCDEKAHTQEDLILYLDQTLAPIFLFIVAIYQSLVLRYIHKPCQKHPCQRLPEAHSLKVFEVVSCPLKTLDGESKRAGIGGEKALSTCTAGLDYPLVPVD